MNKIAYQLNGILCIVIPAQKSDIEMVLGPLTDEQYRAHVMERSIPENATGIREIEDTDIPQSRDFRGAWCDVTQDSKIDIDCDKAKNIALSNMRLKREDLFKPLDKQFMMALEKGQDTSSISTEKQRLRDITDPIKSLDANGKINDNVLLDQLILLQKI